MKVELTDVQLKLINSIVDLELKNLSSSVYFKPELEKLKLALTPVVTNSIGGDNDY